MVGVEYSPALPAPSKARGTNGYAGAILALVWRAKWLVLAAVAAGGVIGVSGAVGVRDHYAAQMVLQSAGRQSAANAANSISQISNLVGLGGGVSREDREYSQFKAVMRSVAMAERLQQKYGLMQILFASEWDAKEKRWIEPSGWRYRISAKIKEWRGLPRWTEPSIYDLADLIERSVLIKEASYSPSIYEITYKSEDREFALRFLDMLHKESEAALREEQRERALEQVRYLRGRIETTPIVEYRLSLVQLMSDQDKTLMLLDSNLPFAVNVIDPPHIIRVDPPKPWLYAVIGAVVGLLLSIGAVLAFAALRPLLRRRPPGNLVSFPAD